MLIKNQKQQRLKPKSIKMTKKLKMAKDNLDLEQNVVFLML